MSHKIAIIPARGGSKRIPGKNIKEFLGRPIIGYSIETALQSNLFDEVMVSTDCEEIASIAKSYGAKVPFLRSEKNSDDFTGPGDVCLEVISEYQKQGILFSEACCIYATAPLLSAEKLVEGYSLLMNGKFDAVFPVHEFSSPIWRSYEMKEDRSVRMNFPEHEKKRSQDLPPAFADAGQFYWFSVDQFKSLSNKNSFGNEKGVVLISSVEAQDIDTESDWRLAEMKYGFLNNLYDD